MYKREYSLLKTVSLIKGRGGTSKGRGHKFLQGEMTTWLKQTFGLPVRNWLVVLELGTADGYASSQFFESGRSSHKFTLGKLFYGLWLAF